MALETIWVPAFLGGVAIGAAVALVGPMSDAPEGARTEPEPIVQAVVREKAMSIRSAPQILSLEPKLDAAPSDASGQPSGYVTTSDRHIAHVLPGKPPVLTDGALPHLEKTELSSTVQSVTESLEAVEMMQSVAHNTSRPSKSQLDVILATMKTDQETSTTKPDMVLQTSESILDVVRPLPAAAQMSFVANGASTGLRPVIRPKKENAKVSRPSFSAKHYNALRFHRVQRRSEIACVAELQLLSARAHIYFESSSATVDARGKSTARLIASKAQSCPQARVSIVGFTDPGGTTEVNQKLSWQRANAVFKSIEAAGFSMNGMIVSSHMEEHPEGCVHFEGVDRRVVFEVQAKKAD